jgi:hypothetical protein
MQKIRLTQVECIEFLRQDLSGFLTHLHRAAKYAESPQAYSKQISEMQRGLDVLSTQQTLIFDEGLMDQLNDLWAQRTIILTQESIVSKDLSPSELSIPTAAETIISYVCTPDRLEAVLGDLERNFARRAAKHGEEEARRWYWWQTVRTVAAFGVQIVVRIVMVRELLRKLGL